MSTTTAAAASARTPAYIDAVFAATRTFCERVLAVHVPTRTVVKATGWRWVGSRRDNWTEVQVVVAGVQRAQRGVDVVVTPLFVALLSVYVGDDADWLAGEVRAALLGAAK